MSTIMNDIPTVPANLVWTYDILFELENGCLSIRLVKDAKPADEFGARFGCSRILSSQTLASIKPRTRGLKCKLARRFS